MSEEKIPEEETQEEEAPKDTYPSYNNISIYWLRRLYLKVNKGEDLELMDYQALATLAIKLMNEFPEEERVKLMRSLGIYPALITTDHGFGWIRNDTIVPNHIKLIKEHLGQDSQYKRVHPKGVEESLIRLAIYTKKIPTKDDYTKSRIFLPDPFEKIMKSDAKSQAEHVREGLEELANHEGMKPQKGKWNDHQLFAHKEFNKLKVHIEESRFKKERGSGESYIFIPSIPWESELHKKSPFLYSIFLQIDDPHRSNKAWLSMGEEEEIKDKALWSRVMKGLAQKLKAVLKTS